MGLWGLTTAVEDKPKFLPIDSNAAGSTAQENTQSQLLVVGV